MICLKTSADIHGAVEIKETDIEYFLQQTILVRINNDQSFRWSNLSILTHTYHAEDIQVRSRHSSYRNLAASKNSNTVSSLSYILSMYTKHEINAMKQLNFSEQVLKTRKLLYSKKTLFSDADAHLIDSFRITWKFGSTRTKITKISRLPKKFHDICAPTFLITYNRQTSHKTSAFTK